MVYTKNSPVWANSPSTDSPISAARLNHIENGIADLGVFAAYTPSTSGITLGNGVLIAQWTQVGKLVHFYVRVTFGSTTAVTGDVALGFPATALNTSTPQLSGRLVSAGLNYQLFAFAPSTTAAICRVANASGTYTNATALTASIPATWTTNDLISLAGTYEAA